MRVAVIDVGSNSVRLLIASVKRSGQVRELDRERVYLRPGDDAYRLGLIGGRKLDERVVEDGAAATTAGLDVTPGRIETLLGGTLVLAEVARRLDSKHEIGRGGLREGAALALARTESAAA